MEKQARLERSIAGESLDRLPVMLYRYWQGDDQRAADLARSVLEFQQQYDWDFVVVAPSYHFSVTGYGLLDEWQGAVDGRRRITKRVIDRSLDWTMLRTLDPTRGDLGKQLECLRLVGEALAGYDTPMVPVIYSPLMQAARLAGTEVLIRHIRTQPDRLRSGLNTLTETTLRFLEAIKRLPLAGIFYVIEHADYTRLAEAEYGAFGEPYDRKILESLPSRWWLNVVNIAGKVPMMRWLESLPIQVLNWQDQQSNITLELGKTMFGGAVCGGLDEIVHLHNGTPSDIREAVRMAMQQTDGKRLILSAGDSLRVTTPQSNIRAVRESVETLNLYRSP